MVLTVGLLGLATLFPAEIRMGAQSKAASGALQSAQRELDQIRQNIFSTTGSFVDMNGNTLDASCGGPLGTSCGNPLTPAGAVDFSAAPAVGHSVRLSDGRGQPYSVRWNVTVTANGGRKIVLACQAIGPPGSLPRTIQIQTLVAK